MTETKYMTVKEYAEKYNMNLKTVYNHINSKRIPPGDIKKVLGTTLIRV